MNILKLFFMTTSRTRAADEDHVIWQPQLQLLKGPWGETVLWNAVSKVQNELQTQRSIAIMGILTLKNGVAEKQQ